ncbi:O-antigen ligase family protein [Thermoleophilia bacterium SCSIO 60948]|nr:O-antigen ligase family protein [Thermoleophilia bacterium SCSIO 60948]
MQSIETNIDRTGRGRGTTLVNRGTARAFVRAVLASLLPALLVAYLSLRGGGYDSIVRGEVGVAVWWIVLIGAVVGALPLARVPRAGWIGLALFAAFCVWTTLGVAWSESAERSVAEMGRVAAYLGVFTVALFAQARHGLRRTVFGIGVSVGVIGVLAALSRFQPGWFPANETAQILDGSEARLSYPLNYWNAVATLMAIGIPLLLVIADRARFVATRALAVATIPMLSLAAFFTLSRGGAIEVAVGLAALIALYPRRLALAPGITLAALGSALLIVAASQRDALESGLASSAAASEGSEMLALAAVTCFGVGLVYAAYATAARYGLGPKLRVSRKATGVAWAATLLIAIVVGLAAGGGGFIGDRWEEFKTPAPEVNDEAARFQSFSGSGRINLWNSAIDANKTEPLTGIGPGTFEYWWSRDTENHYGGFVRDAHSLYLETLAELGIVGLVLLLAFVGGLGALGISRLARGRDVERRAMLAAALASLAVFFVAAGVDWMWEIPVLPVIALLLAAAVLGPSALPRSGRRTSRFAPVGRALALRVGLVVASILGLVAIAIPLASDTAIDESEAAVNSGAIPTALEEAGRAVNIEPYAAGPELQRAMVLELDGDIPAAISAAEAATRDEPTNWRNWLVLSRLEAKAGNAEASVDAYRQARDLNPNSPLFQPTPEG